MTKAVVIIQKSKFSLTLAPFPYSKDIRAYLCKKRYKKTKLKIILVQSSKSLNFS